MGKGAFRGRKKGPPEEALELEKELLNTRALIAQAYAGFNSASDGELVESYIYEIQALQARYSYLLRRRKALEGEGALPAPRAGRTPKAPGMEPLAPKALGETGSAVLPVA